MESSVRSAGSQISAKERRLDQIPEDILEHEAKLIQDGLTVEQRVLLLAEIKDLAEEAGRLEQEVKALIADKARREDQLADYRASLDTYY
jgi:septal ring factor EnvC (AmiA/AmiB activator)